MTIDLKPEHLHGAAFRLLTAVVAVTFIFSATVTSFAYSNGIKTVTVTDGLRTRSVSTKRSFLVLLNVRRAMMILQVL